MAIHHPIHENRPKSQNSTTTTTTIKDDGGNSIYYDIVNTIRRWKRRLFKNHNHNKKEEEKFTTVEKYLSKNACGKCPSCTRNFTRIKNDPCQSINPDLDSCWYYRWDDH